MQKNVQEYNLLTGLRGIAAFWVVFYHVADRFAPHVNQQVVNFFKLGYLAVDFFFVLSGFVIALNYSHQFEKGFTLKQLIGFLIKRIARIYPLHIFLLFCYLSLPILYFVFNRQFSFVGNFGLDNFFYAILLIHNWGFVEQLSWNVPSWSISTEFFAYLMFPLLILVLSRLNQAKFYILTVLSLSFVITLIFVTFDLYNIGSNIPEFGLARCLLEFTMGICVYYLSASEPRQNTLFSFLIALVIIGVPLAIYTNLRDFVYVPLLATALVFIFVRAEQCMSFTLHPILRWLGDISYSVYLSHYLIKDLYKLILPTEYTPIWWLILYVSTTLFVSHLLFHLIEIKSKKLIMNKFYSSRFSR